MRIVYDFGEKEVHERITEYELIKRREKISKNLLRDSLVHFYVKPDIESLKKKLKSIKNEEESRKNSKKAVFMKKPENKFFKNI
jgi:hypothetical protein